MLSIKGQMHEMQITRSQIGDKLTINQVSSLYNRLGLAEHGPGAPVAHQNILFSWDDYIVIGTGVLPRSLPWSQQPELKCDEQM